MWKWTFSKGIKDSCVFYVRAKNSGDDYFKLNDTVKVSMHGMIFTPVEAYEVL